MRALLACAPGLTDDQAIVLLWSLAVQQHMLLGPGESSRSTSVGGSRGSASFRSSAGRRAIRTTDSSSSSRGSGLGAGRGRGSRRALPQRSLAPAAAPEGATDDAERLLQVLVWRLCRLCPAAARQLPVGVRYAGAEALAWLLAGPAGKEVQREVQSTMGRGLKAVLQAAWGGDDRDGGRSNAATSRGSSGGAAWRARGLPGGPAGLGRRRLRLSPGQTGGITQKAGEPAGGGLSPFMRGVLRVLRAMGHATALPPPSHPDFPLVPPQGKGRRYVNPYAARLRDMIMPSAWQQPGLQKTLLLADPSRALAEYKDSMPLRALQAAVWVMAWYFCRAYASSCCLLGRKALPETASQDLQQTGRRARAWLQ